ncbi:hypothetical protein IAQ61_005291, partial [Plenodomus lingam]|uniref:Uncharacterized protein n=1 Tax=Leptosphaeria maculans (strain JN3 / isolate v23.1.3 / race Av1-4-5-6-7-8) TaxID=985895 RepID=E5A760_LEPMJ
MPIYTTVIANAQPPIYHLLNPSDPRPSPSQSQSQFLLTVCLAHNDRHGDNRILERLVGTAGLEFEKFLVGLSFYWPVLLSLAVPRPLLSISHTLLDFKDKFGDAHQSETTPLLAVFFNSVFGCFPDFCRDHCVFCHQKSFQVLSIRLQVIFGSLKKFSK